MTNRFEHDVDRLAQEVIDDNPGSAVTAAYRAVAIGLFSKAGAVSASPQPDDHELGDPLWPIYQKYAEEAPKPMLTYSGWLRTIAQKLEAQFFAAAPAQEPDPEKQRWQAQMQSEVSAAHVCAEAAARPSLASLHPDCPNCSGPLSYTHNKTLSFFSCNGRCKGTFELHSAQDMVKFFKPAPAQEPRIGEPCPTCERTYLGKMGPGDYSCCVCGMGMVEPCEHWKSFDENAAQEQPVENSPQSSLKDFSVAKALTNFSEEPPQPTVFSPRVCKHCGRPIKSGEYCRRHRNAEPASTGEPPELSKAEARQLAAGLIDYAEGRVQSLDEIEREIGIEEPMVSDGFGSEWPLRCEEDGCDGFNQVMRPGSVQCSKEHLHNQAARPSGPSPPQVEPHVICGNCRKTLKWFPSEPHMNHENNDIHCYPGSEETVTLVYVTPVPQTSAEPQNKCDFCRDGDKPEGGFHKGIVSDYKCRADGPEHPIVGPEDGFPCCEHCAKHPGSQWTLKVSQPVSVDATKVEEIAKKAAAEIFAKVFRFDPLRSEQIEKIILRYLRPYFPPASQTPELLAELKLLTVKDGKPGVAFERYTKLWGLLPAIINALGATPASTARTGAHKGDVMHIELKKYDLYLHGLATDHIWLMADGPDSHPIGIRLDCGDSGTVYLSRSQAKDLAEQLHELAAPGSVPQAASGWTVDEAENFKRLASEPQPKPTEHLIRAMGVPQAVESDVQLLINRRSNDEGELRHAWLTKHEHASSISFDQETGVPHHAIYEYPMSSIAQKETNRAFFGAVQHVRDQDTGVPQAEPPKEEKP